MKQTLFAMAFALATLSIPAFAQDARDEPVQFAPGTNGATIKETITGNQTVNYKLLARAGQHMVVVLKTDNLSNYFNIFAPGRSPGDGAMFIGSLKGSRYEGKLPADGEYTVQVFLMRNAARRNEKANYTLEIEIDGTKAGLSDTGNDGADLSWKREGDNWWVGAGKKEFYLIPDAVIFGG